ncbi:MAG: hypothetical protein WCC10_01895 [Tumebacillaceae bacterium]
MEKRDATDFRSALQADFEAETNGTYTTLREGREREMERDNAIEKGLSAAKQEAQEDGLGGQVEELAQQLQQELKTGKDDEDGDGLPLAAKDGLRYDYDDNKSE